MTDSITIMGQEVNLDEEILYLNEDRFVITSPQDADLSPLIQLGNLKELHLAEKKIMDISPLIN